MRIITTLLLLLSISALPLQAQLLPSAYRNEVVEYSLSLKVAAANAESAVEGVSLARVALLPQLSASGTYQYRLRRYDWQKQWSAAIEPTLIQTLYGGGVARSKITEAEISSDIAICSEEFTLLEVIYAADYAYWNLWAMGRLKAAMTKYVEIIKGQTDAIRRRFEEGYTSKGDLLMMTSRLSEAEYELISAEQSRLTSLHNLNILRGRDPEMEVSLSTISPDSLFTPQRIELDLILEQRPDYMAQALQVELAQAATRSIRGAYNPQLKGGISGGLRTYIPNIKGDLYFDGTVFAELSIPIYHFGERRKTSAISKISEREKALELSILRDQITQDESNVWTSIIESKSQMNAATKSLNTASENLDISTYSYNEGLVSVVDLLAAQISWIQNYTNTITSEYNYQIALSKYRKVVGDSGKNRIKKLH